MRRLMPVLILGSILAGTAIGSGAQDPRGTISDQNQLLSWLPSDTETVVTAKGPFSISLKRRKDFGEERDWFTKKASISYLRESFEELPLELIGRLPDAHKVFGGKQILLALQGSRHFRRPLPGFEVMDFEGCSIVVLRDAIGDAVLGNFSAKASAKENISGVEVLVFHQKQDKAEWNVFFAAPRSNIALVANNREYIREVLERIEGKRAQRALPPDLPEWRYVPTGARYWGLRHYDRSQAKLDPTSPFGDDRTFTDHDDQAIGLVFVVGVIDQDRAVITTLSANPAKSKEAEKGTSIEEPQDGVRIRVELRSAEPGVLQKIYTVDRVAVLDYFILGVTVALGRGMYF